MDSRADSTEFNIEPDLAVLLRLLDSATYKEWRPKLPAWLHHRHVATVALSWLVGMRGPEICQLRVCDWRPGKREVVEIRGAEKISMFRDRRQPILDIARDCVGAYLKTVPFELPVDGPLLRRADGDGVTMNDHKTFDRVLKELSGGVVPHMANLTHRFCGYVERTMAGDGTIEHLVGRSGPWDDLEPTANQLRRALVAAHPLGRGMPQPKRQAIILSSD